MRRSASHVALLLLATALLVFLFSEPVKAAETEQWSDSTLNRIEGLAQQLSDLQQETSRLLSEAQRVRKVIHTTPAEPDTQGEPASSTRLYHATRELPTGQIETLRRRTSWEEVEVSYHGGPSTLTGAKGSEEAPVLLEQKGIGEKMLETLGEKGRQAAAAVKNSAAGVVDRGEDLVHAVEDRGRQIVEKAKERVGAAKEAVKDKVADVVEGAKEKVADVVEGAKERASGAMAEGENLLHQAKEGGQQLATAAKETGQALLHKTEEGLRKTAHAIKEGASSSRHALREQAAGFKGITEGWLRSFRQNLARLGQVLFGRAMYQPAKAGTSLPPREVGNRLVARPMHTASSLPTPSFLSPAREEHQEILEVQTIIKQRVLH